MSRFGGSRVVTEATSTGIRDVVVVDYDKQLLADKAKMLQLAEEQLTGVKRITVTSSRTNKSQSWIITQSKPYNLYSVQPVVGRLPDALSGTYTSFGQAEKAIKEYTETRVESYFDEVIAKETNG